MANIGCAVRAGRWNEKKDRTGQEKSHKRVVIYFTYLWRSPHWSADDEWVRGWCSRRNHVCQVSIWNFQGLAYDFTGGSNFRFSYWFLNGPYNSAALLRCLWFWKKRKTHTLVDTPFQKNWKSCFLKAEKYVKYVLWNNVLMQLIGHNIGIHRWDTIMLYIIYGVDWNWSSGHWRSDRQWI